MNEEPIQFPPANDKPKEIERVYNHITFELKKEGIDVIQNNFIDGTVITNKKVPEKIGLRLREFAKNKGFPIKFPTV